MIFPRNLADQCNHSQNSEPISCFASRPSYIICEGVELSSPGNRSMNIFSFLVSGLGARGRGETSHRRFLLRRRFLFVRFPPLPSRVARYLVSPQFCRPVPANTWRGAKRLNRNHFNRLLRRPRCLVRFGTWCAFKHELITTKVKDLVIMGGNYLRCQRFLLSKSGTKYSHSRKEYSFAVRPVSPPHVVNNWPESMIFSGALLGGDITFGL